MEKVIVMSFLYIFGVRGWGLLFNLFLVWKDNDFVEVDGVLFFVIYGTDNV